MALARTKYAIETPARTSRRPERVGDLVRQEMATLLLHSIKDPRLQGVSVTEVKMTADLRLAKVFFSCPDETAQEAGTGLAAAKGFIRRHLAGALDLRYVPDLQFFRDVRLLRQAEMEAIFESIRREHDHSAE